MRHLVIGQRQKAPNYSAFHCSQHGCLITIGQHFVTTRVVHLPKRTETSLITESDQCKANHQLLQLCTVRTAWSKAVHSCKSWLCLVFASRKKKCHNVFTVLRKSKLIENNDQEIILSNHTSHHQYQNCFHCMNFR